MIRHLIAKFADFEYIEDEQIGEIDFKLGLGELRKIRTRKAKLLELFSY